MSILKQIRTYLIWVCVSFLCALVYTRIILGPKPKPATGIAHLLEVLYDFAQLYLVGRIGAIIALLFIIIDVLYLKNKLKSNSKNIGIRFLVMIVISIVLGAIHYVCEKVIDII